MGLDMYLNRKVYVGNKYRKPEQKLRVKYPDSEKGVVFPLGGEVIVEEVAYWRKANQIHNWFVNNVQDGEDECNETYVSLEQLEELVNTCKKVLSGSKLKKGKVKNGAVGTKDGWEDIMEDGRVVVNPELADELLPTSSGYFFGGTDYDEYYIHDLEQTIEQLEPFLEKNAKGQYVSNGEFYYQSSW